jgi:hypothetical protein
MKKIAFISFLIFSSLFSTFGHAQTSQYPESVISCALYNNGDFQDEPFQEITFSARSVGDTGSDKIEPVLTWDSNDRSYPFRYIRFRSAGYLIRGQRMFAPFSQGEVFLRLAVYQSVGAPDGTHKLLKGIDLKSKKDPLNLEVKDPKYGVTIKCEVKNI